MATDRVTQIGRLSDGERSKMVSAFDELVPRIPERSVSAVDEELAEVRRVRQAGVRRHGRAAVQ